VTGICTGGGRVACIMEAHAAVFAAAGEDWRLAEELVREQGALRGVGVYFIVIRSG
jgi:hypothetical protein